MSAPLAVLTRQSLVARIIALRTALDHLQEQMATDRAGAYQCLGPMKVELIGLERRLREADRQERLTIPAVQLA